MKKILFLSALLSAIFLVNAQNVGVGTATPQATLHVKGNQRIGGANSYMSYDSSNGKIQWVNCNLFVPVTQALMQHSAAADGLFYNNTAPVSGQLEYRDALGNPVFYTNFTNGNGYFSNKLGIGTTAPAFPLSFGTLLGDKISLWSNSTNSYGFGIQGSLLQIHTDISVADISFGYGSSAAFTETMRIKGNGKVGIGTINPLAKLHVIDSSVLFSATGAIPVTPANIPVSGEGRRMMWFADKAAFRAGYTDGTHWDNNNVGGYSVAMGYSTTASGFTSTALGNFTTASEYGATAMGYATNASGMASTAMGLVTTAKAANSLSIGYFNDDTDNPDPYNASPSDRIFQIGNGDGTTRSNAITVLRNGYTGIGTISPDAMLDVTRGLVTLGTATAQFRGTQHSSNFNYSLFENTYIRAGKDNGNVILNDIPGGRVGIGTATPGTTLHVLSGISGFAGGYFPGMALEGNANIYFNLLSPNNNETAILFGKASNAAAGGIVYNNAAHLNGMEFRTNGNATRMVLTDNGYLGIGVSDPAFKLDVGERMRIRSTAGNTAGLWLNNDANNVSPAFIGMKSNDEVGFYGQTGAPGWRFYVNTTTGNGWMQGTLTQSSDIRLKKNITPLQNSLQKIIQLGGYHYFWKDQNNCNSLQTGVLAQEVQKLFPELVTENKDGLLAVNYSGLIPVMIESIKEQQKQIDLLSTQNKTQQVQIDELRKMVETLLKQ